jgi:hypothetical protein
MSVPLTIETRPAFVTTDSLLHQTRALLIYLRLMHIRLMISVPVGILNVFVDSGDTLLRTANRWQCIFLLQSICRNMSI